MAALGSVSSVSAGPAQLALVALPGELWLVAGVLVWPLGAWLVTSVGGTPREGRWRTFARAAAAAAVLAAGFVALSAYLFTTNGTEGGFQALAAQLAAGVTLVGALICGVVALVLRRTTRAGRGSEQQERPH